MGAEGKPPRNPAGMTKTRRLVIWGAAGVVLLAVLVGSLIYTEQSSFCPTCHEMSPYYDAWAKGPHALNAGCVDCHIDAGVVAHLAHKPIALKEVWDHFFSNSKFPNYTVEIPNSRCQNETCHTTIPENKPGVAFSHAKHAATALCKDCHTQAGHLVTLAALDAVGVLRQDSTVPVPGGLTPSSAAGHKKVVCQNCHDQATMKCSACHQAPHENRGECSSCHDPSAPFAQGVLNHPAVHHGYQSRPCVDCHPSGPPAVYCTCHKGNPPTD